MKSGFRRTAEGIELTTRTATGLIALAALIVGATVFVTRKLDAASGAVPRAEFHDTTRALRNDLTAATTDARDAAQQSTAVSCYIAKYPVGLCDKVPRATQAGTPR